MYEVIFIVAYLAVGLAVAAALNQSIQFGPIDPGASESPSIPKWVILPLIVLLWPVGILIALWAFMGWVSDGSH